MTNKKYGIAEQASGKIVTITTGKGNYAKQERITFPTFAKGQNFLAWEDYEITSAIQKGVPIEGHFVETKGHEGELARYVTSTSVQNANIKKGKHYEFFRVGEPKVKANKVISNNPIVTLMEELGQAEALKLATMSLSGLKKDDYFKLGAMALGMSDDAKAEDFKAAITAK